MAILTNEAKQKLAQYKDEFLVIHPNNETMDDPNWVDPEDGSTAPLVPKYTNAEWLEEYTKRHFIRQLQVGKRKLLQQNDVIPTYEDLS